jgi:hypothetical protein
MAQLRPVFVALLGIWFFVSTASAQQPAVDPQLLVGEWVGTWVAPYIRGSSGDYKLTITKVDGDRVWGHSQWSGNVSGEHDFEGTIRGNIFHYNSTNGRNESEYVINGDTMKGWGKAKIGESNMSLKKK